MLFPNLPFHIGSTESPHNPEDLPDSLPYNLSLNCSLGLLSQDISPQLLRVLEKAYLSGQLIGTPLSEDPSGKPYADDFLNLVYQLNFPPGTTSLEIGAGVGYLTHCLSNAGFNAIGVEPGIGYQPYWKKYNAAIVNDFFPTPKIQAPFDLVLSYAVLEHISDPLRFLLSIKEHLSDSGVAIFAVPDCTQEIINGDPSILYHEHFSYFEPGSLSRLIQSAGLYSYVFPSTYGRSLYGIASNKLIPNLHSTDPLPLDLLSSYPSRCKHFTMNATQQIAELVSEGSVGIYCAARGISFLDPSWPMRFFDDDTSQHGRFLPPFNSPIESLESLLLHPVDYIVVMSRTFGDKIKSNLVKSGYKGAVVAIDDLGVG